MVRFPELSHCPAPGYALNEWVAKELGGVPPGEVRVYYRHHPLRAEYHCREAMSRPPPPEVAY